MIRWPKFGFFLPGGASLGSGLNMCQPVDLVDKIDRQTDGKPVGPDCLPVCLPGKRLSLWWTPRGGHRLPPNCREPR